MPQALKWIRGARAPGLANYDDLPRGRFAAHVEAQEVDPGSGSPSWRQVEVHTLRSSRLDRAGRDATAANVEDFDYGRSDGRHLERKVQRADSRAGGPGEEGETPTRNRQGDRSVLPSRSRVREIDFVLVGMAGLV